MGEAQTKPAEKILPGLITEQQLATRLGLTVSTLYRYRVRRIGPAFSKIAGTIWYREEDVDSWIVSNQTKPL